MVVMFVATGFVALATTKMAAADDCKTVYGEIKCVEHDASGRCTKYERDSTTECSNAQVEGRSCYVCTEYYPSGDCKKSVKQICRD
jgi:hypothetical protein